MKQLTKYPKLNDVLAQFVSRVQTILTDNIVGIYLQGSFAVGDADEDSDVDIMVVIRKPLPDSIIPTLNQMHQSLFDEIDGYWSKHLEGSYFPANLLRKLTLNQPRLHYFDNGSTTLELSDHDNTLVVRWSMREHGITLVGPTVSDLIDKVPSDALKAEVRQVMVEWGKQLLSEPDRFNGRWQQSFAVVSYCRMLHTLSSGQVHSKLAGINWAKVHLDPRWHGFIQRAQDNRKGQFLNKGSLNHPEDTVKTPMFLDYCLKLANA